MTRIHVLLVALLGALSGATAHAQSPVYILDGHQFNIDDTFASSVSGAGDVDGDGVPDFIVGAPRAGGSGVFPPGVVLVFSGATGLPLHTLLGSGGLDFFGVAVSGVGDLNGDGFDDFIVGAYLDDNNGQNSGSTTVYSGQDGAVLFTHNGDMPHDVFGGSVSGTGDVDGDGVGDFIVGAKLDDENGTDSGNAQVFSGATGALLYKVFGDAAGDQFGRSVCGVGDVDNDGHAEFAVGAWRNDNQGTDSGLVRVFSGATGLVLYTFEGQAAGDEFGVAVSPAGDVNGDGIADLIVGAPGEDHLGLNVGSARVLSGADGTILMMIYGELRGDSLGASVSGAGDVDGDGHDDLIVGARGVRYNGTFVGAARLVSGATGRPLYLFRGEFYTPGLGYAVSDLGDVSGDGLDDFIVGAIGWNSGTAYVLSDGYGAGSPVGLGYCTAERNSTRHWASIHGTGTDRVRLNDLTLNVEYLPSHSLGFFLVSPDHGSQSFPSGSIGVLCVAGPSIGRFVGPGMIQNSMGGTSVSLSIDLNDLPTPFGSRTVAVGESWYFQYWYRDFGSSSNFSDGLRVVFQ